MKDYLRKLKDSPDNITILAILLGIPLIMVSNSLTEFLQFDRSALANGQYWRLFTGHLTHWNFNHLFWDLLACLAAVKFICIIREKSLLPLCITAMPAISAFVLLLNPEITIYRGLSGLDTTLFTYIAIALALTAARHRQFAVLFMAASLTLLISLKIGYEAVSGGMIFVADADFIPLYTAHLGGFLAGAAYALGEFLLAETHPSTDGHVQILRQHLYLPLTG